MTKTMLVTGATAGIGAASARRFVAGGWRVVGTGRRGDRLRALQDELGEAFLPLEVDMRDRAAVESLAHLDGGWGDVDLLVNNAGLAPPMGPLPEVEWDKIQTVLDTNMTGLVALTRALLPTLIERKGAIVNLSSVAATYPYQGGAVYAGTKSFVRQFSLDLRCDLAGTGVRVTSIEPGMAETEFTLVRTGGNQTASDNLYKGANPMTAENIAETLFWIATLPPHMNINRIELMPVNQSFSPFQVHREGAA